MEVLAAVERASGKKIDAESVPRRAGDPAKVSGQGRRAAAKRFR
jgi:UDP-glucose 4-epimerase